jgi:carbonic anhydrase
MKKILEGLNHFQKEIFPQQKHLFESLADGQAPHALFITCGDSRIVPSLFTQTQPGELFISRQVGNIVPPHGTMYGGVSSTVEYAVGALGVKHVILCGHSDCGAMRAVLHPETLENLPNARRWLGNAEVARQLVNARCPNGTDEERLQIVTRENVRVQLRHLETHPVVAVAVAQGNLELHGWVYHLESGDVDAYDPITQEFRRITFDEAPVNPVETGCLKV